MKRHLEGFFNIFHSSHICYSYRIDICDGDEIEKYKIKTKNKCVENIIN